MVVMVALGVVLVLASLAPAPLLVLAAVRRTQEKAVWWSIAAGACLSVLAYVPVVVSRSALGLGLCLLILVGCYLCLFHGQIELLRQRVDTHRPGAWLDRAMGLGLSVTLGWTLLLQPMREVESHALVAMLLIALPALALTLTAVIVLGLVFSGRARDPRMKDLATAVGLLALADVLTMASTFVQSAPLPVLMLPTLLRVVGWLLIVRVAFRPVPPPVVERRDEDGDAVLVMPAVCLLVCGLVFALDHGIGLPTPAVVAAVVTLALVGVKVALVFARVTALNSTRRQAFTDELTGLGNRRALASALTTVGREETGLVTVDLDGFKAVNDRLGHALGDELLQQVAARVKGGCRPDDVVVRQGGDEFAVVVRGPHATAGAVSVAERLAEQVRGTYRLGTETAEIGASIGVASSPDDADDAEALMRAADTAMYRAKAAGGGVVLAASLAVEPDVR